MIVTLKSPFVGKSTSEISALNGVSPRTITEIYNRACARGFDPNAPMIKILPEYLADAPRSGRPRKQKAAEKVVEAGVEKAIAPDEKAAEPDAEETDEEVGQEDDEEDDEAVFSDSTP